MTHLVVSDNEVDPADIPPTSSRVQVVKQKWFWESIQIDACVDEQLYQAKVNKELMSMLSDAFVCSPVNVIYIYYRSIYFEVL